MGVQIEVPHRENSFTLKDKDVTQRVFSKIDWLFINQKRLSTMLDSRAKVTIGDIKPQIKRYYRYCNAWVRNPLFMKLVETGWRNEVYSCRAFKVVQGLKTLKRELKRLNTQHFQNIITGAQNDKIVLQEAQSKLQTSPMNIAYHQKKQTRCQKLRRSSYLTENHLQQKSKVTWLRRGD